MRSSKLKTLVTCCAALAALSVSLTGLAQSTAYPTKPIQFVVGFAAGGPTDIVARVLSQRMSGYLGQPVIVINQPGADSLIGTTRVAQAEPNGYTILISSASHTVNASLHPEAKLDPEKDFSPVSLLGYIDNFLVVHPSLPVKSVKEFVALAKRNPGKINFGAAGSQTLLATELFNSVAAIKTTIVPYKGAGAMLTATISGEVEIAFSSIASLLPQVKAGKLRALAVTGARRSPIAPEVPTLAEAGYPGYGGSNWFGMFGPANTPRNIVQLLNSSVHRALRDPEALAQLEKFSFEPAPNTPEQFAKFVQADVRRWAEVYKTFKARGIKAE